MGATGTYYNVDDYVSWKRKQGSNFRSPPRANFLAAANHIRTLFDGKKFNWAAMGGLAMLCLGSRREMPDIHIIYEDRDFSRMKMKLQSDPRAKLPQTMNPLFPSKILLGTGPMYKDVGCTDNFEVEIDLIPPGSHGSPPNDVLRKNQVLLRLNLDGKMNNFKGLNMLYLVKTSLHYCKNEDLKWDPKEDILFMCQHYAKEIEAFRSKLHARQLESVFFSTLFYSKLSTENQRSCSLALLGKELLRSPPPTMAITPPPNMNLQPPSLPIQNARPPLHTSKSTPQLHNNQQASATYLTPPLPGKAKTSPRQEPPSEQTQPLPASRDQVEVVLANVSHRDPRSRYRTTSAQSTPGHGRSVSADTHPNVPLQQRTMDYRGPPQQPGSSMPSQGLAYRPRPQGGQASGPLPAGNPGHMPQNSMPNMRSSLAATGPVPVYSHPASRNVVHTGPVTHTHLPAYGYTTATVLPSNRGHIRASSNGAANSKNSPERHQATSSSVFALDERPTSSSATTESPQTGGLKVVGPKGLYPTPPRPAQPSVPSNATKTNQQQFTSNFGPISPPTVSERRDFPVELPANAYSDISPLQSPDTNVQGPASIVATQRLHPNISQFNLPNSSGITQSPLQSAMIAELPAAPTPLPAQPPSFPSRPTHPRTHSEPITSLPSILMAGRPSPRHSPNNSINHPSPPLQPQQQAHTPQIRTNANRYTQYSTDPYATPPPTSVYKAYTAPINAPIFQSSGQQQHQQQIAPTDQIPYEPVFTNYQGQDGSHMTAGLQPNVQHATGYEDFAHGPYTPVVSNEEIGGGRPY